MIHHIHPQLLAEPVRIRLVGCGGNGSQMLTGLARLHLALRALDHPGLDVTAQDCDTVSPANIGRQLFAPGDVGLNKATVLVYRLNVYYGLAWRSAVHRFRADDARDTDIVVSCVDTRAARVQIGAALERHSFRHPPFYWLDLGNRAADGQVVLGIPAWNAEHRASPHRLPHMLDLFPELRTEHDRDEDQAPSCSLAEALGRQELFINHLLAGWALQLLWTLFRTGMTTWHGVFLNARTGRVSPMPVDPAAWERFGYCVALPIQQWARRHRIIDRRPGAGQDPAQTDGPSAAELRQAEFEAVPVAVDYDNDCAP